MTAKLSIPLLKIMFKNGFYQKRIRIVNSILNLLKPPIKHEELSFLVRDIDKLKRILNL